MATKYSDRDVLMELWEMANQGLEWALEDFQDPDKAASVHYKSQGKKDAYRTILATMRQRVEGLPMPTTRGEQGAACPLCGDPPITPIPPSPNDEKVTKLTTPGFGS